MMNRHSSKNKIFSRVISLVMAQVFLATSIGYAAPSERSLFKNKRPDYKAIQEQTEGELQKKKEALRGKKGTKKSLQKQGLTHSLQISALKDLSYIYIPEKLGRVVEVYESPSDGPTGQRANGQRLIVHIQDLHTNAEAQYNEAGILEILVKDYGLGLICSEGAEGEVDTSSVSSFPDPEVREKTARMFVESGELTAEEYLSITKYPDLPIWGIEDKDIYFQNIIEYNKIMRFLPGAMTFINGVKETLEELKPEIYSKKLLDIDAREKEYEKGDCDTNEYLDFLLKIYAPSGPDTTRYKNIVLLEEALEIEKTIDQKIITEQSQDLLRSLQGILSERNKPEMDTLLGKAALFKEQKISPFSFYSYLGGLASRYLKDDLDDYPEFLGFAGYLAKVNSLDSIKLFQETEELTYEIKDAVSTNENQKLLTRAIRHIKGLDSLFNLKVSNEELDYYLSNKNDFSVNWFKTIITDLTGQTGSTAHIDYNSDLIDMYLPDLEHFYEIAKERDIAMIRNAASEIERRNVKVAALITGGFHTRGLTGLLKEKGYSYVVISPYSSTEIDEENYKNLLSGKRKPISEMIEGMNNKLRPVLMHSSPEFREAAEKNGILQEAPSAEEADASHSVSEFSKTIIELGKKGSLTRELTGIYVANAITGALELNNKTREAGGKTEKELVHNIIQDVREESLIAHIETYRNSFPEDIGALRRFIAEAKKDLEERGFDLAAYPELKEVFERLERLAGKLPAETNGDLGEQYRLTEPVFFEPGIDSPAEASIKKPKAFSKIDYPEPIKRMVVRIKNQAAVYTTDELREKAIELLRDPKGGDYANFVLETRESITDVLGNSCGMLSSDSVDMYREEIDEGDKRILARYEEAIWIWEVFPQLSRRDPMGSRGKGAIYQWLTKSPAGTPRSEGHGLSEKISLQDNTTRENL